MRNHKTVFTAWLLEWVLEPFHGSDICLCVLRWRAVADFPDVIDGLDYVKSRTGHVDGVVLPSGVKPMGGADARK